MLNRLWMQHIRESTQFKCHHQWKHSSTVSLPRSMTITAHTPIFNQLCDYTSIIHIPQSLNRFSSPLAQTGPLTHDYVLRMGYLLMGLTVRPFLRANVAQSSKSNFTRVTWNAQMPSAWSQFDSCIVRDSCRSNRASNIRQFIVAQSNQPLI